MQTHRQQKRRQKNLQELGPKNKGIYKNEVQGEKKTVQWNKIMCHVLGNGMLYQKEIETKGQNDHLNVVYLFIV